MDAVGVEFVSGQRNTFSNSVEALVDLDTWPGEGSYRVEFVATNRRGKTLAQRTITIKVAQGSTLQPPAAEISVWWPSDGAEVSGVQPFKAVLDGADLADYEMFWRVDDGELHSMGDSLEDHPHKEASVDVSDSTWNGSGPYQVTFVAESPDGGRARHQDDLALRRHVGRQPNHHHDHDSPHHHDHDDRAGDVGVGRCNPVRRPMVDRRSTGRHYAG